MNKTGKNVADLMEGRASTEGSSQQCARILIQSWENTMSRLLAAREVAIKGKKCQFTSLFHHLSYRLLEGSFWKLKRGSAASCDGVTWKDYSHVLNNNLLQLHHQLRSGGYKPKPARRVLQPLKVVIKTQIGIA